MKFTLECAGEFTCNFSRPVNDVDLRSSGRNVLIFVQRNTTASNRWRTMHVGL